MTTKPVIGNFSSVGDAAWAKSDGTSLGSINATTGSWSVGGSSVTDRHLIKGNPTGQYTLIVQNENTGSGQGNGLKVLSSNASNLSNAFAVANYNDTVGLFYVDGTGTAVCGAGGLKPGPGESSLKNYTEAGTFSPTVSSGTPGTLAISYSNRTGQYTRIGNVVFFAINVSVSVITIGTASGPVIISNMPGFTYDVTPNKRQYFPGRIDGTALASSSTYPAFQMVDSTGVIYISSGNPNADLQIGSLNNSTTLSLSGFCFVT